MGETVSIYLPARLLARLDVEDNKSQIVQDALDAHYAKRDIDTDRLARIEKKLDKILAGGAVVAQAQPTSDDAVDASAIDAAMEGW